MSDVDRFKQAAGELVVEAAAVLDAYLAIDDRMFSWKNTFGWNDVSPLKPLVQPLIERLLAVSKQIKDLQSAAGELPEEIPEKAPLLGLFKVFINYVESLRFAVQTMGRVLEHIETRRINGAEFKKTRYESDLLIYKSQIDKYQLYGEQLNTLIRQLR
ncbi:hypothetical protein [Gloeobacter morelensis]|uniref:Uncharacterized protein n=1 Tax=Gloeobacter morelensis MG652769 TaxID=2781736 RepID=A0ABY3PQD5_9CYAN|nr:hypothetical protein [Gloeobacter morelensis]UFP95632.1 hypothetical protein ISF26_05150 [Gloeobacter morelensis MG652769]